MKLILAIINRDDANAVTQSLTKAGFSSTKLSTTGGFLMSGNVTILVGVDEERSSPSSISSRSTPTAARS